MDSAARDPANALSGARHRHARSQRERRTSISRVLLGDVPAAYAAKPESGFSRIMIVASAFGRKDHGAGVLPTRLPAPEACSLGHARTGSQKRLC